MYWFDPLYLIMIAPAALLAFYAQIKVKSAFSRYSRVPVQSGVSGAEAAAAMLRDAGLFDVGIEETRGWLSDHYDPRKRVLRLSPDVYRGRSVAAVGVACHEAGHAVQHADNYAPLALRNAIVPVASIGSWAAWPMIFLGLLLQMRGLALIGVIAFAALVPFQVITLPVEFNASRRAKERLANLVIVRTPEEQRGVAAVLDAAALTYVAATVTALAQLLYFALRLGLIGGGDD
jgi:hypothetical protein